MAEFVALPGTLNVQMTKGDEFSILVDLDIDVTNFTWAAIIYAVSTTSTFANPGGVSSQGATVAAFTVTFTNVMAAAGQVNLSLTEQQTDALVPGTSYRWYLRGVSPAMVTRTYLSGSFTVYAP
jgi:hypothetical protein